MLFRQFVDPVSSTYTYLLASAPGREAVLIDPVKDRVEQYALAIDQLDLRLVKALDTHTHADHVTALGVLRERTDDAGSSEDDRRAPTDMTGPRMRNEVGVGIQSDCERTGADRHVRIAHPDHIQQQRYRECRAAATGQCQRKTDQSAAAHRGDQVKQRASRQGGDHCTLSSPHARLAGMATSISFGLGSSRWFMMPMYCARVLPTRRGL